jgi:hypothetical protein
VVTTTTMLHRRGQRAWLQAPERDQVHHGHHRPRDRYWAGQDGAPPLIALMAQAVASFEPLLNALQSDRDGA